MLEEIKKRRLTLGELFGLSGRAFARNLLFTAIVVFCVGLPINIVSQNMAGYLKNFDWLSFAGAGYSIQDMMPRFRSLFIVSGVTALMSVVFEPLSLAAVTHIADETVRDKKALFSGILDASLMKWAKLIVTYALYALLMYIGFLLLFIPGIFFAVSMYFCSSAAALTDKWGPSALAESRRLVRGNWWRTFGLILLIGIMELVAAGVLELPEGAMQNAPLLAAVYQSVIQIPLAFFSFIPVFYFLNLKYMKDEAERHD